MLFIVIMDIADLHDFTPKYFASKCAYGIIHTIVLTRSVSIDLSYISNCPMTDKRTKRY